MRLAPLFSEEQVRSRVDALAAEIAAAPRRPDLALPILAGSFVFAADLLRALARRGLVLPMEFIWLRSYGAAHTGRYSDETFAHWEFASGTMDQVKGVAQYFGLRYFEGNDQIIHGLRTVIVAPDGKVFELVEDPAHP